MQRGTAEERINDVLVAYGYRPMVVGELFVDVVERLANLIDELDEMAQRSPATSPIIQAAESAIAKQFECQWHGLPYWDRRR